MMRHRRLLAATMTLLITAVMSVPVALADPPPQAPAHGWRAKHDHYYVGYTGHHWKDDYGIREGHCDRDRVGTVLGAVVGGAVGSAVGNDDNRLIAILAGATIGAIIGHEIGEDMDHNDRACFGHSLEMLEDGRRVHWDGARSDMRYTLTPSGRFQRDDRICRRFTLVRVSGGHKITRRGSACRFGDGEWRMTDH
ncbi:MAG: glycine zipper 2TM domain-containing protein [Gammaproteobacteria bacterium]|nr:glycine zipper 2TM domain-containing protein [Gammaproteobacteria bacterium]